MTDPKTGADPAFRADVHRCFAQFDRAIPARWLYDRRGSELFDAITRLPEYYLTRVETTLLEYVGPQLLALIGPDRAVVELGAGSATKTPHVLRHIAPSAYVPVDISGDYLADSAAGIAAAFPGLTVLPVEADFMHGFALPAAVQDYAKLGFFPGSTIGNLIPRTGVDLLRRMRETLGVGAQLLIGMDRIRDIAAMEAAYNDSAGVTSAFTLNLLHRINRELDGDIPVDAFVHRSVWNDRLARIEAYVIAQRDLRFRIDGTDYAMAAGEQIHAENSHKYDLRDARLLLRASGWTPGHEWCDADTGYMLILAEARPSKSAP